MTLDTERNTARPECGPDRYAAREAHQRLEHEREARLAQCAAIEGTAQASDEVTIARWRAIQLALAEIDAAFARLREDTYGVCQGCCAPIPAERLEILPYARFCVRCQRGHGQR
jgi:DnaK suppressor protein